MARQRVYDWDRIQLGVWQTWVEPECPADDTRYRVHLARCAARGFATHHGFRLTTRATPARKRARKLEMRFDRADD